MGNRQALVGPRGHDGAGRHSSRVVLGAGRRSSRVMVGDGLHWSRVVGGTGRRGWRVLLVAGGSGYWFIVVWASSLAMFVSSSWVVVIVVLWWGRGLLLCFIIMSCQLPHGRLLSSCIASSSIMVTVLQSLVCVSSMMTNDDQYCHSSFGCQVAAGDMTPVSDVKK